MTTPTITRERAIEIATILRGCWSGQTREYRDAQGRFRAEGITEAEDAEIRALWATLPGNYSFASTVAKIARGW